MDGDFMKRICKYCGKELKGKRLFYCNDECKKLFEFEILMNDGDPTKRYCKHCRSELDGRKLSYCNDECRKLYESGNNYNNLCNICGREFIGKRNARICSNCNSNKVKGNCIHCGKEIVGSKSKKYCSRSCQNKNATLKKCVNCDKEFRGHYNTKFCSEKCKKDNSKESLKGKKIYKIKHIIEKHTNLILKEDHLLSLDFEKTENFQCINNHEIKTSLNKLLKLDKIECDRCDYDLNPNFCLHCGETLKYEKRKQKFCSSECCLVHNTNKSINNQSKFETDYGSVLSELFSKGYSELKIAEITNLKFSNIRKFILNKPDLKNNLCLLDNELIYLIKANNKIDLKTFGFTRTASQYFKDKYSSFSNFIHKNNLNVENKLFKCSKCNQFHPLDYFSTSPRLTKQSYFGIGICRSCRKSEKIKRRSKSKNIDKLLTSEYINYIKDSFNNKCAICGDDKNLHIDHFIPLAWNMDKNIKGNYIILCEKCNSHLKSDLNYIDWINKYDNIDYKHKLNDVLLWLAQENNMTLDEYKTFYWDTYKSKTNRKK